LIVTRLEGETHTIASIFELNREDVISILRGYDFANQLELSDSKTVSDLYHCCSNDYLYPVVIMFWSKSNVHRRKGELSTPIRDGDYSEVIFAIPGVRLSGSGPIRSVFVKVYLSNYGAIRGGKLMWGFPMVYRDNVENVRLQKMIESEKQSRNPGATSDIANDSDLFKVAGTMKVLYGMTFLVFTRETRNRM